MGSPTRNLAAWLAGAALLLGTLAPVDHAQARGALPGGWQEEYLGTDSDVLFFPDRNVNYWTYRLSRRLGGRHVGIRIQGAFPDARYMGITVYDEASRTAVASLPDVSIEPDPGSVNPLREGRWYDYYPANYYTVYVVPRGAAPPEAANVIEYDGDVSSVSIFLRYYLPGSDERGGYPLPSLSAFDVRTGEARDLPQPRWTFGLQGTLGRFLERILVRYVDRLIEPWFSLNPRDRLLAYRASAAGLYANDDNQYLTVPINKDPGEVAVVRFRPPSTAGRQPDVGAADMRYWSVSLGDRKSFNYWTLSDVEAKVAPDGYVYVVIGPPTPEVVAKAEPYNFIPWEIERQGVLIYRNLLTREDFRGAISRVPELGEGRLWRLLSADHFIGDYAPSGVLLSLRTFLSGD